jgi:arylsulfatase A-like enzyme
MEQEETRSIRTKKWLFMKRITPTPYEFKNELYDLEIDPDERNNLAGKSEMNNDVKLLSDQIDKFYSTYSHPKWDLWQGGAVKSNSTRPFLWKELWGEDWVPEY